jgi:hypothetical protein
VERTAAVAGESITLTPVFTPAYPDGFVFAATTMCQWELRWGDDASLHHNLFDATFGSVTLRGSAADGYCGPWTFTLPYQGVAQWQFNFRMGVGNGLGVDTTLFGPAAFFTGSAGKSTGNGITESNLPGVWLSLPTAMRQGDMVTATAHPFGGYVLPPDGANWDAYPACNCQAFATQTNQSLEFTFKAKTAGTIAVFYNDTGEVTGTSFAGAGVDPKVIAVKTSAAVPSVMRRAFSYSVGASASGFVGPVRYTWYVDGRLRFVGRTGHLRLWTRGWHSVKVVATDGHGHRATKVVSRYVRP